MFGFFTPSNFKAGGPIQRAPTIPMLGRELSDAFHGLSLKKCDTMVSPKLLPAALW